MWVVSGNQAMSAAGQLIRDKRTSPSAGC